MYKQSDQERLEKAVNLSSTIPFETDIPDREFPNIKWAIYGLIDTNEIVVKVIAGNTICYSSSKSILKFPKMADRIFGLDVVDRKLANTISDKLWDEKGTELKAEAGY